MLYIVHGHDNKQLSLAVPHGRAKGIVLVLEVVRVAGDGSVAHKLPLFALLLLLVLEVVCGHGRHEDQVAIRELDRLFGLVPPLLALGGLTITHGALVGQHGGLGRDVGRRRVEVLQLDVMRHV